MGVEENVEKVDSAYVLTAADTGRVLMECSPRNDQFVKSFDSFFILACFYLFVLQTCYSQLKYGAKRAL